MYVFCFTTLTDRHQSLRGEKHLHDLLHTSQSSCMITAIDTNPQELPARQIINYILQKSDMHRQKTVNDIIGQRNIAKQNSRIIAVRRLPRTRRQRSYCLLLFQQYLTHLHPAFLNYSMCFYICVSLSFSCINTHTHTHIGLTAIFQVNLG